MTTKRVTFGVDATKPPLPEDMGFIVEDTLMAPSTRQYIIQDSLEIMNLPSPSMISYHVVAMGNTIWDVSVCIRNPMVPNVNERFQEIVHQFILSTMGECIIANNGYPSTYQIKTIFSSPGTVAYLMNNLSAPAMGGAPKQQTCVELRQLAARLKVKGNSRMTKAQLLRAIQKT